MSAIFGKEFKNMMRTMIAPIFIAYVLFWFGISTSGINIRYANSQFEYAIGNAAFISLLAVPLLTMRSFSEERHNGSDKLLYSLPIKTRSIVIAKYLASVAVFAIPTAVVAFYPFVLAKFGTVYLNTAYSALLAYFILGAALIAIGIFISALTESQVIAAIISLMAIFLVANMSALSEFLPSSAAFSLLFFILVALIIGLVTFVLTKSYIASTAVFLIGSAAAVIAFIFKKSEFEGLAAKLVSKLDFFSKLNSFFYGILDVTSIIFFLSVIVFFLFLTCQAVEKKRWN